MGRKPIGCKHLNLCLRKILTKCDDNQHINMKWHWKKSAHAHSLTCFPKNNMFLSLITTKMEGCKPEQLEVEGHEPI